MRRTACILEYLAHHPKMAESRADDRINNPKIRWYFGKEELRNSPSRVHGVDPDKELGYRQHAANMIQDMGQRLNVCVCCVPLEVLGRI